MNRRSGGEAYMGASNSAIGRTPRQFEPTLELVVDSPGAKATATGPFTIECLPRVLDDVRLAAVDAFFALPHGGIEIGGILLGSVEDGHITVVDSIPFECDHASGPSFVISVKGQTYFGDLLRGSENDPDRQPVGWYRSNRREEIALTFDDLDIQERFFPKPWNLVLIIKAHASLPARAAFFLRGPTGEMSTESGLPEFEVKPLGAPAASPRLKAAVSNPSRDTLHPVPKSATFEPPLRPAAVAETRPSPSTLPASSSALPAEAWRSSDFLVDPASPSSRSGKSRTEWTSRLGGWLRPGGASQDQSCELHALDYHGQLQIRWDKNARAAQRGSGAVLMIVDGAKRHSIPLDAAHLQGGSFTYGRDSERVEITLGIALPNGQTLSKSTIFLGRESGASAAEQEARRERDRLRDENATLKSALDAETARARQMNVDLGRARQELDPLREANHQLRTALDGETGRAAAAENELDLLREQKAKFSAVDSELTRLRAEHLEAQSDLAEEREWRTHLKQERDCLRETNTELKTALDEETVRASRLDTEGAGLREANANLTAEVALLKQELDSLRAENARLAAAASELEQHRLEQEVALLREESAKIAAALDEARAEAARLTAALSKRDERNGRLEKDIKDMRDLCLLDIERRTPVRPLSAAARR
jgi:hypothetical protein